MPAASRGAALPAFLPAALVPLYLRNPQREVPLYRKQLALLSAVFVDGI